MIARNFRETTMEYQAKTTLHYCETIKDGRLILDARFEIPIVDKNNVPPPLSEAEALSMRHMRGPITVNDLWGEWVSAKLIYLHNNNY